MTDTKQAIKKFVQDPEWYIIENEIHAFIDPLITLESIDDKQSAEDVKAQVKANKSVYNKLDSFLRRMGLFKKDRIITNQSWK